MDTDVVTIKVLSQCDGVTAIWSVDVAPMFNPGRLCGAWVNPAPEETRSLLSGNPVARVGGPAPAGDAEFACLDVAATRDRVVGAMARLVELNRQSRTPKGNARAPLQPVAVPALPDAEDYLIRPWGVVALEPAVIAAITHAQYLASLADVWAKIETLRLARDYLVGDDTSARPFPCVVAGAGAK